MRRQMTKQDTTWENLLCVIGLWMAFVSVASLYM